MFLVDRTNNITLKQRLRNDGGILTLSVDQNIGVSDGIITQPSTSNKVRLPVDIVYPPDVDSERHYIFIDPPRLMSITRAFSHPETIYEPHSVRNSVAFAFNFSAAR